MKILRYSQWFEIFPISFVEGDRLYNTEKEIKQDFVYTHLELFTEVQDLDYFVYFIIH